MNPVLPTYRLCPRCFRAVPHGSGESYCPNDGARMLTACKACGAAITSPYAHFCVACGRPFAESAARSSASSVESGS